MKRTSLSLLLAVSVSIATAQSTPAPTYLDPAKPIDARVADLVGRLTFEKKVAQLNYLNTVIPRLHTPAWGGWNHTMHGVRSKQ